MKKAPDTYDFDRLPDPIGDRVVKDCPLPPHRPLNVA